MVFRYPVYRDLITRVLEKADVCVAGVLDARELDVAVLRALRPDVVVIYDPDSSNLLRDLASSTLLDPARSDVRRIVCIGSENEMVVLHLEVIANPSVERLIDHVRGATLTSSRRASAALGPAGERDDSDERPIGDSEGS